MTLRAAYLFPGQGAQYVGMGKDLYEIYPEAKKTFDTANHILGFSISDLCFLGPEKVLTETANAQTAIFVTSIAGFRVFETHSSQIQPVAACGLSLGEFSALVACGSLTFEDGIGLVRVRSKLMNQAANQHPGTMASILGLGQAECETLCQQTGVQIANINSPEQIVLSGERDAVLKACGMVQAKGGKVVPLNVSGAFHSRLMESARDGFQKTLRSVRLEKPKITFIPNVTGKAASDPEQIRALLHEQLTSSVQWVKTMAALVEMKIQKGYEIGPGKVLKGLAKRNRVNFDVLPIETAADIRQLNQSTEEKVC